MTPERRPRLYMDAVITPHRSLSPRGFLVLMAAMVGLNGALAAFFLSVGAVPIPVFLGLDVLALYVAFKVSYAAARVSEVVQVSAEAVVVHHQSGRGVRTVWRSPTAFTNVDLEDEGEHEARVRVRLSGRRLTVAAALSPPERVDFAKALRTAVARARDERW